MTAAGLESTTARVVMVAVEFEVDCGELKAGGSRHTAMESSMESFCVWRQLQYVSILACMMCAKSDDSSDFAEISY